MCMLGFLRNQGRCRPPGAGGRSTHGTQGQGAPTPVTRNAPASLHLLARLKSTKAFPPFPPSPIASHRPASPQISSQLLASTRPTSPPDRRRAPTRLAGGLADPINASRIGGQGGAVATRPATHPRLPLNWPQLFLAQLLSSCRGMVQRFEKPPRRH